MNNSEENCRNPVVCITRPHTVSLGYVETPHGWRRRTVNDVRRHLPIGRFQTNGGEFSLSYDAAKLLIELRRKPGNVDKVPFRTTKLKIYQLLNRANYLTLDGSFDAESAENHNQRAKLTRYGASKADALLCNEELVARINLENAKNRNA